MACTWGPAGQRTGPWARQRTSPATSRLQRRTSAGRIGAGDGAAGVQRLPGARCHRPDLQAGGARAGVGGSGVLRRGLHRRQPAPAPVTSEGKAWLAQLGRRPAVSLPKAASVRPPAQPPHPPGCGQPTCPHLDLGLAFSSPTWSPIARATAGRPCSGPGWSAHLMRVVGRCCSRPQGASPISRGSGPMRDARTNAGRAWCGGIHSAPNLPAELRAGLARRELAQP